MGVESVKSGAFVPTVGVSAKRLTLNNSAQRDDMYGLNEKVDWLADLNSPTAAAASENCFMEERSRLIYKDRAHETALSSYGYSNAEGVPTRRGAIRSNTTK